MTLEELHLQNMESPKLQDTVIISFGRFNGIDEIHKVDAKLFEQIPKELGIYDGHEVNMDDTDGRLFAYGKNAETLFKVMKPLLNEFDFLKDADVYLKFTKDGETVSDLEFKMNHEFTI
jgi:hypothetical protein